MKDKFKSIFIPVVMMALPALALSVQTAPLTVTKSVSPQERAAALAYWTRARIAAAPAMVMPVYRGPSGIDTAALAETAVIGPAESSAPGMAKPDADLIAQTVYAQDWAALDEVPALDMSAEVETGTEGVYTFYDVNTQSAFWKIYPHVWDGKLTFTMPSGEASCSATVISGNNIVTAAHCVYDTINDLWYSGWVFTPAYRNGSAPYGTFATTNCSVLPAWVDLTGDLTINWVRYDVAVCTMDNNSAGQTLNEAVGWAGRLWNAAYQQLNFNSGYPAQNYNGNTIPNGPAQYLRSCTNKSFQQTTETLGGGCYWGAGISGGSWLIDYKPFIAYGYVNSVNSVGISGQQNLYGPRFNSSNIVPLCTDRDCGPLTPSPSR